MTAERNWMSTYFSLKDDMSAIEKYLNLGTRHCYKKGEPIISLGSHVDHFIYLKKGKAGRLITTTSGAQKYIKIINDQGIIGEVLFFQHENSNHSFEAIAPCECYFFDRATVNTIFLKDDTIVHALINWFCNRMESLSAQVTESMEQNSYYRVCNFLIEFVKTFGVYDEQGHWCYEGKLSHYDIAKYIGINRVSVTRALAKLQDKAIIQKDRQSLIILDPSYFEKF